jgi:hypothetical protein
MFAQPLYNLRNYVNVPLRRINFLSDHSSRPLKTLAKIKITLEPLGWGVILLRVAYNPRFQRRKPWIRLPFFCFISSNSFAPRTICTYSFRVYKNVTKIWKQKKQHPDCFSTDSKGYWWDLYLRFFSPTTKRATFTEGKLCGNFSKPTYSYQRNYDKSSSFFFCWS